MSKYVKPDLHEKGFNCPHCNVYAHQTRFEFFVYPDSESQAIRFCDYEITRCDHCQKPTLWLSGEIDYPSSSIAPEATEGMPAELKKDFDEARSVLHASPRASAALLRLVVQRACNEIGDPQRTINENIKAMVENGLPVRMQQLLDAVRVIGNESVHPGELNLDDDLETALTLFDIVNRIVEAMIIEPRRYAAVYNRLPASTLKGIQKRDSPKR